MSEDEELSELSEEEFPSEHEDNMQQDEDEQEKARKATRQEAMDKLVPALDPADYGKMPPEYYSNSQRVAPVTMESEQGQVTAQSSPAGAVSRAGGTATAPSGTSTKDEGVKASKPIRRPILPRDKFDGVDSDDETDEEGGEDGEESEEDRPQVVGEIEIDMDNEREEFLEFSRTTLGISDDMWNDILRERKERGGVFPL